MKNIFKIQKDGVNTLKDEILSHSNNKLKKVYYILSDVKETGYDVLEECLIDLKARKFIAFGIDKKNTTKGMLEGILKYTKTVYVYDNNSETEFYSGIIVFEYEDKSYVYLLNGSLTDSMLETDLNLYNVLEYDLTKDEKDYNLFINSITKEVKDNFIKLTKEAIEELVEGKKIFTTKQYIHNVPSIAELLGKKEEVVEEEPKVDLPKIDLKGIKDVAFEIDLGDVNQDVEIEEVPDKTEEASKSTEDDVEMEAFGLNDNFVEEYDENLQDVSDEVIDLESVILDSEIVKLDKKKIAKKEKGSKELEDTKKQKNKKIDLEKVSNIIMELPKKPTKGKDINKIKIPNYIKDIVPVFFETMDNAKLESTAQGEYKISEIKLEIIDVNNSNKYSDTKAHLKQKVGQTYLEFESDELEKIEYEEMDIVRIIKLSNDYYHIEIIPKSIEEYKIWKKLCTNDFRGSSRQYGLM